MKTILLIILSIPVLVNAQIENDVSIEEVCDTWLEVYYTVNDQKLCLYEWNEFEGQVEYAMYTWYSFSKSVGITNRDPEVFSHLIRINHHIEVLNQHLDCAQQDVIAKDVDKIIEGLTHFFNTLLDKSI